MLLWRRYLVSSLFEAIGTPLLYLLALGVGLGTLVDKGPHPLGGVGYVHYLAPALLTAAALQTAMTEGSYPTYARLKWTKVFFGVVATPISPRQVADGQVLFIATRLTVGSALYYLVILLFGAAGGPQGLLMIPVGVLLGVGCGAWVVALAGVMRSEGAGFVVVARFVILPMTLFSGTFFPITELSPAIRWLAWISPLWHGNELARGAALGTLHWWPALGHLGFLIVLGVTGVMAARRTFAARLVS